MLPNWLVKPISNFLASLQFFPAPAFIIWGTTSYQVKGPQAREVLDRLQPGDILLRRYERYVTSWIIPGYWKHVAIYVGDNKVIHAVSEGVVEEDILTFLRCDRVAIMRVKDKDLERAQKEIPVNARKYLGLEYDFEFDTGDDKRFYCSEFSKKLLEGYDVTMEANKKGFLSKGSIIPDAALTSGLNMVYTSEKH